MKKFNEPEQEVVIEEPKVELPKKEEPKVEIQKEDPKKDEPRKQIDRPYIGQTEEELVSLLVKWRDIYRSSIISKDKENAHAAIREIEKEQKRRK